jgi:hypothetical protein
MGEAAEQMDAKQGIAEMRLPSLRQRRCKGTGGVGGAGIGLLGHAAVIAQNVTAVTSNGALFAIIESTKEEAHRFRRHGSLCLRLP